MENAQLIGLSRQVALRRQMDVIANNMANLNTAGFKGQKVLFEDYLMPTAADLVATGEDQIMHYTQDWATVHDFMSGAIQQTGGTFDIALNGDGFLAIQTPDGVGYTRNGELKLDNTGLLVTNDGHPVLSEGGLIRFEPNETGIQFTDNGTIMSSAGNKGHLQIVRFDQPQALVRVGSSTFTGDGAIPDADTRVVQGAIERSNVSGVTEMTNMIQVNRAYQSITNMLQRQDELRRTAIQRLGSLQA